MKTYKKIDLFYGGDYLCSTNQSKTCREAREKYILTLSHMVIKYHPSPLPSLVDRQVFRNPKQLKAKFNHGH